MENSKSQIHQDLILDEQVFKNKTNGFFVEVGALDGFGASNTWFFEMERNWSGLLIEPNPIEFEKRHQHPRPKSVFENCAISDIEKDINFLSIEGPCNVLSGIIEFYNPQHLDRINKELEIKHGIKKIDLLSIDVEGAESQVLNSINFDKVDIDVFLIENNYGLNKEIEFLSNKGYKLLGNIQWDSIFVKNNL